MAAPKPEPGQPEDARAELSDGALCDALVAGQRWAADALYERVEKTVDTVLYRVVGAGDAEREDLMQQALEKIVRSVVSGNFGRRCALTSWAALVTQHVAYDALRARARERAVVDRRASEATVQLVPATGNTPEGAADLRQQVEAVRAALAQTKQVRAEAVILHDLLGHELIDIAKMIGVSITAAQSRLVRGRRELAAHLEAAAGRPRSGRGGRDA
jgi:RNA polymerase sigma-70 factor, ECF subfamily